MSLFLGQNQHFYKKIIHFFVIWHVKFLKFIVFSYLDLNLMLYYSTYYILSCLLIKPAKIFSCFASKTDIYIQVYFGKCIFCKFIDIRALSYYENDVHIVNISNRNSIYHVLWYHIKYWHPLKEGQVTLDRSPQFFLKPLIYMHLLKTDHALVTAWWGHFCPQSSIWSKFKYVPSIGRYQVSRPSGFKPGYFVCFNL